ncbi:ATP-binding protein [Roseivirga sp.]|uniref:sensor histidine kinase n=1 Tax=Roseivirga sp. TaxID=1964215 RepID=UPI003B51BED3
MLKLKKLASNEDNFEYLSRASIEISTTYLSTQRNGFALDEALEAIKYARLAENLSLEMVATYNIGIIKERNNQIDSALYYYRSVESYQRERGDTFALGTTLSGMSSAYANLNDYESAIELSKESANLYRLAGNMNYLARRLFMVGDYYLFLESLDSLDHYNSLLDSAEHYFQQSRVLSDSLDYSDPGFRALRGLAVTYQRKGQYERALNYMYLSNNITQRLYSDDIENKLLDLREKYNTTNLELEAQQQRVRALEQERGKNITMFVAGGLLIIFSIWLYIIDQRRKNIKAIAAKNEELNRQRIDELLQQQEIASLQGVLEGQEQERKRVAIDLHDRLGGILSMVKLHFSAVEEKLPEDNPGKKKFLTASELLDLAAGEVRNISHNLLSGVLAKFGLMPALKDLTDRINESGEIKLNLIAHNVEGALNSEQELQSYRIVQELISNILKHADAKEANIQLIRNDEEKKVNLIVEDDGKGFDPKAPSLSGGIGLSNLKARVNKLNGSFHIDSGKGAGTSVSIDIPIEDD